MSDESEMPGDEPPGGEGNHPKDGGGVAFRPGLAPPTPPPQSLIPLNTTIPIAERASTSSGISRTAIL